MYFNETARVSRALFARCNDIPLITFLLSNAEVSLSRHLSVVQFNSNSRYSEPMRAIHAKEAKNGTSHRLSSDAL